MTLNTTGLNLEGSFNKWLRALVTETQTEINALLGSSYTITYYPNRSPESFPSVQSQFFSASGQSRGMLFDLVQIDVRTQSHDLSTPGGDRRLSRLITDSLKAKLGFSTKRNDFYAYFPLKDYVSNPSSPATKQNARIELFAQAGWAELPEEDKTLLRHQIDFQIFYR